MCSASAGCRVHPRWCTHPPRLALQTLDPHAVHLALSVCVAACSFFPSHPFRHQRRRSCRNGDGLLNFDEFKSGLRDLGVQLPDTELVSIWHEASSGEGSKPAGIATLQRQIPGHLYGAPPRPVRLQELRLFPCTHCTRKRAGRGAGP